MNTFSSTLAAVLALSPTDRAAIARALRAADAGLEIDPASIRASSDAESRTLCGRAAPAHGAPSPLEFAVTPRHVEILREATARVAAMHGVNLR